MVVAFGYGSWAGGRGLSREELYAHLVEHGIAGPVATPRENNLRNYRLLSERDPRYLFGLEPDGTWTAEEVLALMADRCGVSPDSAYRNGPDTIDPERTLDALDELADRLRLAAERRERVLVATGHPAGLLGVHMAVAAGLARAGCRILRPGAGWRYEIHTPAGLASREVRYLEGVGVLSSRGELNHTHSARPIRALLGIMAERGEPLPDLVVGDHGWTGGAGQAGVDAVGFADSNDPALFVGQAEKRVRIVVPLDDNIAPHRYEPLTAYLLGRAGLFLNRTYQNE